MVYYSKEREDMKTIRFYDMMIDCIENGVETSKQISHEFNLDLPVDFDLDNAFDMLNEKTGYDIYSFKYEEIA
jgi:hypothetical protein